MTSRAHNGTDGPKTTTLPGDQRGAWFEGVDLVTGLNIYGTSVVFSLDRGQSRFLIGKDDKKCDIVVGFGHLSRTHCVLERRAARLRVRDLDSRNGLIYQGRREAQFDLRAGESFIASGVRFVAMNDEMRAAFPTIVEVLGGDDEPALSPPQFAMVLPASEVLLAAVNHRHLLITGEEGCDHVRLAREIHHASLVRNREIVEIERVPDDRSEQRAVIDRAARSTLVLALAEDTPVMDAAFASTLFSPSFHVRVIVCAPSVQKASDVLGSANVNGAGVIALAPLARRRAGVLGLLDRMLEQREAPFRAADLTQENQRALQAYDWPKNFDDLRLAADRLIVFARVRSFRAAEEMLGVPRATLHYWYTAVGLSKPILTASR